jgi:polyisoprenoid-binding protein YceI
MRTDLLIGLMLVMPALAHAQNVPIRLEAGSRIWLQGTAGPVHFSCQANQVDVTGQVRLRAHGHGHDQVDLFVTIPVASMDCGLSAMNKDLRAALKADRHPAIRYSLGRYTVSQPYRIAQWVDTSGQLSVAGETRAVNIRVLGQPDPGTGMRLTGHLPVDMTDFKVVPPSPLMGLVKVDKELNVYFDVVFRADRQSFSVN